MIYVLDAVHMRRHIEIYLEEARESRFQVVTVEGVTDIDKDHFWMACYGSEERDLQKALTNSGYRVGEGFRDGNKVLLFPVSRR